MRTAEEVMYLLWKSPQYKWTQKQIADLFNCDVATVCRKIEPERWKRWEIVISSEKLRMIYNESGSIRATAEKLWCAESTVRSKLHKFGIPVRRQGKPQKEFQYAVTCNAGGVSNERQLE